MIARNLQATPTPKAGIKGFYGINRKMKGSTGECVDCQNVDGDEFPCLRSVKQNKRALLAEGKIYKLLPPEGDNFKLCGVLDNKVVGFGDFQNLGVSYDTRVNNILKCADGLITLPNMWVYNTKSMEIKKPDAGEYTKDVESDENVRRKTSDIYLFAVKASPERIDTKIYEKISYININDGAFEWSQNEEDYFLITRLKDVGIMNINGSKSSYHCLEVEYYKKDDTGVFVKSNHEELDKFAEYASKRFSSSSNYTKYTLKTAAEEMPVACIWYNRVWACSANGRQIRCSKLGEFNNFEDYDSGAASSWFCEVGSDGEFTGIIPYNDAVFAFKENCVHVVYGTTPQNFSLEKTFDGFGCIDERSICVVNNALYWLGYNGVYRYVGNSPKLISEPLNRKYKSGVAFSDNRKVFFNLTDYEGHSELLSFDTMTGIWHRYTYKDFIGGFNYNGKLYAYTSSEVFEIYGGDYGEWSFESVVDYNDSFEDDTVTEYHIRAYMTKGSSLKIEYKGISESDWEFVGEYAAERDEMVKEIFTPRFKNDNAYQYRLSGSGEVYIHEMEKYIPQGGRRHSY